MLVVTRQGPFKAWQIPKVSDLGPGADILDRYEAVFQEIAEWCGGEARMAWKDPSGYSHIRVSYGDERYTQALPHEWIVEWDQGKFRVFSEPDFDYTFQEFGQLRDKNG